jgi:DNA mismatch endonuclease (patch repair protein)
MARVKSQDTKPELAVRRLVHSLGYRYRLHRCDLPGNPDLVFPRRRAVIFVHGCFWHQHTCRAGRNTPKSRMEYWQPKLAGNSARDRRNRRKLKSAGWRVLTIWECQIRDTARLSRTIVRFLEGQQEQNDG